MKRRRVVLVSIAALFIAVAAAALWVALTTRTTIKGIPGAYAAWAAVDLVIDHMEANEGAWPTGWDDIFHAAEIREQNGWQVMWEVDELPGLVAIDWAADPTSLALAAPIDDEPPFHIITRPDGTDFTVAWDGREPNRMILDYLRSKAEAVSGE